MYVVHALIISGAIILSMYVILTVFVFAQEPIGNVVCNTLNITNLSIGSKLEGGIDILGMNCK